MKFSKYTLSEFEEKLNSAYGIPAKNKGTIDLVYKKGNVNINVYKNGTISVLPYSQEIEDEIKLLLNAEGYQDNKGNRIFIVHGHDMDTKKDLEHMLFQWGLQPYSIIDDSSSGSTIIEKLVKEARISKYGMVLLTPDDLGYSIAEGEGKAQRRARQNVILEMGMLIGLIGREKVAILRKADTEIPSDASGILYIAFNEKIDEIKERIRKELRSASIVIND
jgi:predicted nucleotide-binding protein